MLPLPRAASRQLCTGKITGRALRQLPLVGKSVRRYKLGAHFHSERFDGLGTIAAEGTTHGNCQAVCGEKKKASALYGKIGACYAEAKAAARALATKAGNVGNTSPLKPPASSAFIPPSVHSRTSPRKIPRKMKARHPRRRQNGR